MKACKHCGTTFVGSPYRENAKSARQGPATSSCVLIFARSVSSFLSNAFKKTPNFAVGIFTLAFIFPGMYVLGNYVMDAMGLGVKYPNVWNNWGPVVRWVVGIVTIISPFLLYYCVKKVNAFGAFIIECMQEVRDVYNDKKVKKPAARIAKT